MVVFQDKYGKVKAVYTESSGGGEWLGKSSWRRRALGD
jgi:hypothetical protein